MSPAAPDAPDPLPDRLDVDPAGAAAAAAGRGAHGVPVGGPHRSGHLPPRVELGHLAPGGLAPGVAAIVERAVLRRPDRANRLAVELELKVVGPYPAVRVRFLPGRVIVEDGAAEAPALRVEGALPDLIALLATPVTRRGGLPNPATPRGRATLTKVATGKVRFEGPLTLRREILGLLRI